MRRILKTAVSGVLIVLSLLLLLETSFSCQSQETAPTQSATVEKGKSFIWKISSDTTSVYLLGSVHIASQELYPLDKTIEDAFESADYLVVEVNTNNISQDYAVQLLMKYGTYSQGDGFKENVPEDLYNKLDKQFKKYGIGLALLDEFRPFVIYNMMSQFILEGLGYKGEYGIDLYFMGKAEKSNIIIMELETTEFQMDLLSSIPDAIMMLALQYDIDNPETEKYLQELFNAWADGDAEKMETIVFEALIEEPDMAPYYEKMYDQRNFNMTQKIEEYLADDEIYFIVVGAGHMVGENGLINLLKNKGYDVEQLYDSD
ncbi:MAG: hypothetical protein A2Y58_02995 [Chloroflexi bacterium RBG_13_51_52]|nr:MAG: hypothetical protein A2Y58_02995 [Chloroflexi bacterium RBG_13_51_52]